MAPTWGTNGGRRGGRSANHRPASTGESRRLEVPRGHPLVGVADAEHRRLVERSPDDLERERPAVGREPARHSEGGQPQPVEWTREAREPAHPADDYVDGAGLCGL